MILRGTLLHVGQRIFGNSEHLKNVASEDAFGHFEIDLFEVRAHHLLRGVVHEDVNGSESSMISYTWLEALRRLELTS